MATAAARAPITSEGGGQFTDVVIDELDQQSCPPASRNGTDRSMVGLQDVKAAAQVVVDLRYAGKITKADAEIIILTRRFRLLRKRAAEILSLERLAKTTTNSETKTVLEFMKLLPLYREEALAHSAHIAQRIKALIRERMILVLKEESLYKKLNLRAPERVFADAQLLQDPVIGPLVLTNVFRYATSRRLSIKQAALFYLLLVGKPQTERQIRQALLLGRPLHAEALRSDPNLLRETLRTSGLFQCKKRLWQPKSRELRAGFRTWVSQGPVSRPGKRMQQVVNLLNIRIYNTLQRARSAAAPAACLHAKGRPTKQIDLEIIEWLALRGVHVATMAYLLDCSRNSINKHALPLIQTSRHKPDFKIVGTVKHHVHPQLLQNLTAHGLSQTKVAAFLKLSKSKLDWLAKQEETLRRAIHIGREYARCRRKNIEPPQEIYVPTKLPKTDYVPNFKIISQHPGPGRPPTTINATLLEALLARGLNMSEVVRKLHTNRGTLYRHSLLNPSIRTAIQEGRRKGGTLTKSGGRRIKSQRKAA